MNETNVIKVIEHTQAAVSKWETFASMYGTSRNSTNMAAATLAKVRL